MSPRHPAEPVLVIGEALIDIVDQGEQRTEYVGGSPANVAMGLATLGHRAGLATYIADDARGQRIFEAVRDSGAEVVGRSMQAERTPTATAHLDPAGGATYDFDLTWEHDAAAIDDDAFGHVHTGSIAATLEPGGSALEAHLGALYRGHTISYDPNARPTLMGRAADVRGRVEQLVGFCDVVKVSDEDLEWFYPQVPVHDIGTAWAGLGPRLIVITRGEHGALVRYQAPHQREPEWFEVAGHRVDVADTVGAGDSFMSGLLSGLLDAGLLGKADARERWQEASTLTAVRAAVDRGTTTAAWTVERSGAGGPTRVELAQSGHEKGAP